MSDYPETFDPTGPGTAEPYHYVNWTAVSVQRVLATHPDTSWEALPDLLGQAWSAPNWYQDNAWLADFYTTVYEHSNGLDPVHVFTVDELGEPATDLARIIDAVVQSWLTPVYHADPAYDDPTDPTYDGQTDPAYDGQTDPTYDTVDSAYAADPSYDGQTDPAQPYGPDGEWADGPDGPTPEPLTDLDPDAARAALARVVDDEADDISDEDQQVLATVLTVEEFQYLAREFDLV
ncbi:hypothetical protein [Micromonospora cathayae]|uniref:Uncharacterized protein n=1 Tax=Micromonospora cathayae TaxID=3028804 RepID=A0ABY7ZYR7_9ACTN|nr:hypothetical protein [Micromonospora sp. HUAS 3]WDZ87029.1 hypothetical protein PVK37_11810 [Micromonospora sp. HUAS 3]